MGEHRTDIESFLAIDGPVLLHLAVARRSGQRYRSVVRGWVNSRYVMLDRPRTDSRYLHMERGEPCVVRFLNQGNACGFESMILDWDTRPHISYCLVSWPEHLDLVSFRKCQRVDLYVPCRILFDGKEYEAEVRDLSISGCRVSAPIAVTNNETVELTFTLPDGIPIEGMRAYVRNAHPTDTGSFFGCEFTENQEHIQSDLAFYVAATLDRSSADRKAAPRVLIIEQDQERIAPLRQAFMEKGWHVFETASSIEALLRVRMMPPTAVLVNQEQSDVAGVQFMDLLKAARWVETIPVYIYGPAGRPVPGGAKGYFSSDMSAQDMCDSMAAEVRPPELP
jgi:c-di-GMP-binding flagellar brake protein YcgR